MDFGWLLLGLVFFILKNPHKRLLFVVSFFLVGLVASQMFWELSGSDVLAKVMWILSSIGLIASYCLRFSDKDHLGLIDYFKIPALILLVIYPGPFYVLMGLDYNIFWTVIRSTTFCFVGGVFIYDRVILKPEAMKKKFIVVLVVQSVLILLMLMYAFVQQAEANRQRQIAEEQSKIVRMLQMELEKAHQK